MNVYRYQIDSGNKQDRGLIVSKTLDIATRILKDDPNQTIQIEKSVLLSHFYKLFPGLYSLIFLSLKVNHIILFLDELQGFIQSGFSVSYALRFMKTNTQNKRLHHLIYHCHHQIQQGFPLSQALKSYSYSFPQSVISSIESGEETKQLDQVLKQSKVLLDWEFEARKKIIQALLFPVLMVLLMLVLIYVMLFIILPKLMPMFTKKNTQVPFVTELMIQFADFITQYGSSITIGFFVLSSLYWAISKTPKVQIFNETIFHKIPLAGTLIYHYKLLRFSSTMSLLMNQKTPLLVSLSITQNLFGTPFYQKSLATIRQSIKSGHTLGDAVEKTGFFPNYMVQMIRSGENNHSLPTKLKSLSESFFKQINNMSEQILNSIQYIYIAIMLTYIIFLLFGFYLPLINININI